MKYIKILIQPVLYGWFFIILCLTVLPVSILALPFNKYTRLKLTAPFWKILFSLQIKTVFMANVHTEDYRDEESKSLLSPPGLYIANHQSFADIPLIFSHLVIPPIMKKEVLYIPILGICVYSSGGIIVDRKNKNSRKQVFEESKKRLLEGNKQLYYFPEGTRQKKGMDPKPFSELKTPLLEFAFKNKIPVYPVSVEGTSQVLTGEGIQLFKSLGIILHKAILAEDFKDKDLFMKSCWDKVIEGKRKLNREIYS
jgi:1-acyl-sn-glycerol-3-phosphate acyltransferase